MQTLEQIKQRYEQDQMRAAEKIYDAAQLPINFESIAAEWLTGALCRNVLGAKIEDFSLVPAEQGTTNRRSIDLKYNGAGRAAGLPSRVFCKATQEIVNRYTLGVSGAAMTEVNFYNHVRPLLKHVNAPEGVFANYDPDTYNSIVILKDLSNEVLEFCTQDTTITRERAEDQIGLLARLHGQCYAAPAIVAQRKRFMTWPEYFNGTLAFGMKEGSEQGFARASDLIPARLHRRAAEIWPATVKAVNLQEQAPTLAHGDVHLKNWYVTKDGAMALSDWQCVHNGHWGRDFGYAVTTALTVEDRRKWEKDLLALYIDRQHAAGGPKMSFAEAWLHYRRHLMSALTWWTITYNPAPDMPDMQPLATSREFVKRIATAMDDLETLDSLG